MVGSNLGGFALEAELGAGTMATVYRARAPDGWTVALKLFHPFLRENQRMLARFKRESELLSRLVHPNIIRFRGYYEVGDAHFYVMDHLSFGTVEELLETRGRLELPRALGVAVDMVRALAFAHERAVIHRDLKPSNLFFDPDRELTILTDFGLAKSLLDVPITAAGTKMMGTPNYMAPEQVEGAETSPVTDIYQAGLVLYELLTGERPFADPHAFRAITKRCELDLPLESGPGAALPVGLKTVLRRACARDPARRPPNAQQLLAELEVAVS